ncbi:MAG: ribosome biogenesis/translation initiation ATPase RLI [Candidatus Asgardarchaeia archaeon]
MVRVAVVDRDKCKPQDCNHECQRFCPQVRIGYKTITFDEKGYPIISEPLCTGCGICIKKCPFKAISIVNLPEEIEGELVHQFGKNTFRLYRLPIPKINRVSGLIGANGTGKSTAIKILSGSIKPNLGNYDDPPDWDDIIGHFKGSELQGYFKKMADGDLRLSYKPQYITKIPKVVKGVVRDILSRIDERGVLDEVKDLLNIRSFWDRDIKHLSGGELQRVAIAATILKDADVYLLDEPSSYLDVKERINAAKVINSLSKMNKTVIIIEHDLAVLDYLSHHVCIFYGVPGTYGIVSSPYSVRAGINVYLDGYLPGENVRFRDSSIKFDLKPATERVWGSEEVILKYPDMEKELDGFHLKVKRGEIHKGEVVGILGPNGIGKTTFIKMLAGILKPDNTELSLGELKVSYKPQYLKGDFEGTVREIMMKTIGSKFMDPEFNSMVIRPLGINELLDLKVSKLSGGELQRVAIAICLGRDADLYLLDEPSAFLDIEERLSMTRVVRRLTKSKNKAAFVVEHDVVAVDSISDSIVLFLGKPGRKGNATSPMSLREGMNRFLKSVGITFRRDPNTGRPRVNADGSRLDRMQKELGEYYYIPLSGELEGDES